MEVLDISPTVMISVSVPKVAALSSRRYSVNVGAVGVEAAAVALIVVLVTRSC